MATRPTLHVAVAKTKNTASDYNDNFDMMMDFIDDSIGEAKDYVDDFMPDVAGQSGKFLTNDGTGTSWSNSFSGTYNFTGTTKVATVESSTNDTKAASTAFVKNVLSSSGNGLATFSKNTNGYYKFTNGLIIQWGRIYDDPENTKYAEFTQTLPTPFSNTKYSITVGSNYKQINGDKGSTIQVWPYSASAFKYSIRYEQSRGSYTYWVAIGY